MASFNGARYIQAQIASILPQLHSEDELIIVDDSSSDLTFTTIESIRDNRIRLYQNRSNIGVIKSFERSLLYAKGDFIFLSDQDDLWEDDKVARIVAKFCADPDLTLILTDARVIDANGEIVSDSFQKIRRYHSGAIANIVKNTYLGCAMAFRRSALEFCIPFPERVPMHDMWIGILNEIYGKTDFIDERLIRYRRHGGNATGESHASPWRIIGWRTNLVFALAYRILQIQQKRSRWKPDRERISQSRS